MSHDPHSECRGWHSIGNLLCDDKSAPIAWLGAPLGERSLTPGRCDLAPSVIKATLPRISTYDLEGGQDLSDLRIYDGGDVFLKAMAPVDAFAPLLDRVAALCARHSLIIMAGGNNAVTRPGVHGLAQAMDVDFDRIGLLTLDAHFDLRDTDCGLTNGNPVQALLDDGFPGKNIAQIGLQPFANTRRMHEKAKKAGIYVQTINAVRERGITSVLETALNRLEQDTDAIYVDFDIDVISRHEAPGAPGGRPDGMTSHDFFNATRQILRHAKVRAIDLTEFDPALDVSDITALVAGRWVAEVLSGYRLREI